jgi:hypothetical protein
MIYDLRFTIGRSDATDRKSSASQWPMLNAQCSMLKFVSRAACLSVLLFSCAASAFPPAPHHTLFGMVRNQFGDPLNIFPANVFLETPSGIQLRAGLMDGLEPGANYRLEVPMDSGTSGDPNAYQPTALKPFFQFKLKVQIAQTTYVPIEMVGNFAQIGQPSQKTRIDLTLGVDSDGDGLPDAWEQALISIYGGTLGSINPNDDTDADGISNLNEYLAGTYAFDPNDGFRLALTSVTEGASRMEFLAIRGRTYTIQSSPNLQQWTPVNFSVVTGGVPGALQNDYPASDIRNLLIEVPFQTGTTNRYFRAMIQ